MLGAGGNVLLGPGGMVATDPMCCCGGGNPTCPCAEGVMYPPFHNAIDDTYHSSVTNDCCTLILSYGPAVSKYARFQTLTAVNDACGMGYTGSITCVFAIDPGTCLEVAVSCSGEIDLGGECIENCSGIACDSECIRSSCASGTTNTTTLSDPCDLPNGACCISGVCVEEQSPHCDDDGGFYYGDGSTCPQETCVPAAPTGACCAFGSCFDGTTESDCSGAGGTWVGAGTSCTPDPC